MGLFTSSETNPSAVKSSAGSSCNRELGSFWAWFNSRIFAGDKSGVAGVELATASEPPARQPRIWGRRPSGVDPSHP
jgi:hypothetical protein